MRLNFYFIFCEKNMQIGKYFCKLNNFNRSSSVAFA